MNSIAIADRTINVPFHGANLFMVSNGAEPFVPMKPIVEGMGLTWQSQHEKLKQRFSSTITEIVMVALDGKQREMTCLAFRKFAAWLASIQPNKVRPEIRERVIQYQEECGDVLYYYWTKGGVVNPRKAKKALPGKITADQQEAIKQLVLTRGKALPKERQAKAMITMWSALKTHFGVTYKEIDSDQFTEALSLAARVPLDGEYLGKQEALPAPRLEINFPLQWWIDNNPAVKYGNSVNIVESKQNLKGYQMTLDVTMDMLTGDNDTSPAIQLINILEAAGFNVSAPKAEIVGMRKHLSNIEYGMRSIADACTRASNKKIIFRGGNADFVIG